MEKKKWFAKDRITKVDFIRICEESESMVKAATKLEMHFNTFKKRATELGCYKPNQSGKDIKKIMPRVAIDEIIIRGNQPQYQTYKLKLRLIEEGYKENKCEVCGIIEWNNQTLIMELDHIDGNRTNHHIDNLRLICPNCHAQTETYRSKNRK